MTIEATKPAQAEQTSEKSNGMEEKSAVVAIYNTHQEADVTLHHEGK